MTTERNYGIEFLRVLLCFGVICVHFCNPSPVVTLLRNYPVPIFMMLSFMFMANKLDNFLDVKQRLKRLFIPYFGYPLIYIYNRRKNHKNKL